MSDQPTCINHPNRPAAAINSSKTPNERICRDCASALSGARTDLKSFEKYVQCLSDGIDRIEKNRIDAIERKNALIGQIEQEYRKVEKQDIDNFKVFSGRVEEERRERQNWYKKFKRITEKINAFQQNWQYLDNVSSSNLVLMKIVVSSRQGLREFVDKIIAVRQFKQKKKEYLEEVKSLLEEAKNMERNSVISNTMRMLDKQRKPGEVEPCENLINKGVWKK